MPASVEKLLGEGMQIRSGASPSGEGPTCDASLRMYSKAARDGSRGQTVFEFDPPTGLKGAQITVKVDAITVEAFSQNRCQGKPLCMVTRRFASIDLEGDQWMDGTPNGFPGGMPPPKYPFPIPMERTEAGYYRTVRVDGGLLQAMLAQCGCGTTEGAKSVRIRVLIVIDPTPLTIHAPCGGTVKFDFCDECQLCKS